MLTITRLLAHRLRTVFSRALGRSSRVAPVLFRSDGASLTVGVLGAGIGVECYIAGRQPAESFALPLELLKRCEGTKDDPVRLERRGNDVEARWTDAGVPQSATVDVAESFSLPPVPDRMEPNDPRLITALRDAADSTDDQSTRYALGCMQLMANGGRIAATDAGQLLIQQGFVFPWEGEVLVPGNPVFACRDLHGEPVMIGRTDDWVTLRAGTWTIHLRIEKEARFPNVDSIVPRAESATSVLKLDSQDCDFLIDRLPKLPAGAESDRPVTCDLNGQVLIRGKGESDANATELVLTNSRLEGRPMVVQTNRELLSRAVKLGFREVLLYEPSATVLCRDEHRSFVWMLLNPSSAVAAGTSPIRVSSPVSQTPVSGVVPANRIKRSLRTARNSSSASSTNGAGGHKTHTLAAAVPVRGSAIEQLIALRDTLKSAVRQANDAIRSVKREKREHRLLRSTLKSLRQLQGIAS